LKAQVPGINPDDLDVAVNSDSVTISGEYRYEDNRQNSYRSEFQQDQVQADYTDGILTLHLPKVEQAANQKVKINTSTTLGVEAERSRSLNLGGQSQQAISGSSGQS
jgi:HSP20 family protein